MACCNKAKAEVAKLVAAAQVDYAKAVQEVEAAAATAKADVAKAVADALAVLEKAQSKETDVK